MGWSGRAPAPPANEAGRGRRRPHEATDPWDFRLLLRAHLKRPRRRAAEQRDELAPSQAVKLHRISHQPELHPAG
jgi:hypothetical protein